jgi:coenzyme F420-reducing hydrogenase delta subunit
VVEETRELLELVGLDPRRLHLKWISASEGALFAREIGAFVELLKTLGRIPPARQDPGGKERNNSETVCHDDEMRG